MPIITSGPSKRRLATTENLIFSRGQSAKAALDTALESNPVALIDETLTLRNLEEPRFVPPSTRFARRRDPDAVVTSPSMSEDQAKERANKEGFTWSTGATTEDAFEFIAERRKRQQKRQAIMAGAPQDLTQMGVNFSAMLAASIVDPINVASGFIPVVGATRWAVASSKALQGAKLGTLAESVTAIPLLARYEKLGRMTKGSRLAFAGKVGFTEGAVGATVVEPLVYSLSNQLQDDYTFADSALNILIGSVLGSALHIGGTALTGRLPGVEARPKFFKTGLLDADTPAPVREAAAKTAVVQVTEGRQVDVEDILTNELEMSLAERAKNAASLAKDFIASRVEALTRQVVAAKRAGYLTAKDIEQGTTILSNMRLRLQKIEARIGQLKGVKRRDLTAERTNLLKIRDQLESEMQGYAESLKQVRQAESLKAGKIPKELRIEMELFVDDQIGKAPTQAEINQRVINRIDAMRSRSEEPSISAESKATVEDVNTVDLSPETLETRTQAATDERTALQEDAEAAGVEWDTPEIKAAEQAETSYGESVRRAQDYMACRRQHG